MWRLRLRTCCVYYYCAVERYLLRLYDYDGMSAPVWADDCVNCLCVLFMLIIRLINACVLNLRVESLYNLLLNLCAVTVVTCID